MILESISAYIISFKSSSRLGLRAATGLFMEKLPVIDFITPDKDPIEVFVIMSLGFLPILS